MGMKSASNFKANVPRILPFCLFKAYLNKMNFPGNFDKLLKITISQNNMKRLLL